MISQKFCRKWAIFHYGWRSHDTRFVDIVYKNLVDNVYGPT